MIAVGGVRRRGRHRLACCSSILPLLLLLLLLLTSVTAQSADPNDPSTWQITSCTVTNFTAATQTVNLTLNIATADLLYLVLPSWASSSSLFSLALNNPNYVETTISTAPGDTDDYLQLYSSATNVSDPDYLNNTVIAAGVLAATGSPIFNLSLSLPPSSVFTIYYLLTTDPSFTSTTPPPPTTTATAHQPLYTQPLAHPATTNLTVPAACIPAPQLSYCPNLPPTTHYPSYTSPYGLDGEAALLYGTDRARFSFGMDCGSQLGSNSGTTGGAGNGSICADCLAVRQRWRCASVFSGCSAGAGGGGGSGGAVVAGGGWGGPCRWLCAEKNSRCGEVEDCSVYATSQCNDAWSVTGGGGGRLWVSVMCALSIGLASWVS